MIASLRDAKQRLPSAREIGCDPLLVDRSPAPAANPTLTAPVLPATPRRRVSMGSLSSSPTRPRRDADWPRPAPHRHDGLLVPWPLSFLPDRHDANAVAQAINETREHLVRMEGWYDALTDPR